MHKFRNSVGATALAALVTSCGPSSPASGSDAGADAQGSGEVTTAHGDFHRFVVNSETLPMSRVDSALDLNGDGRIDNQYGNIVGALASQMLDSQSAVDAEIAAGHSLMLLRVQTADAQLQSDGQVGVTVYTANDQASPDFSGSGSFTVNNATPPVTFYGRLTNGRFSSNDPATTPMPVTLTFRLPFDLSGGGSAIPVPLNGAHLQFSISPSGLMQGQINGSISQQTISGQIIPSVAQTLTARIMADPTSATSRQIAMIFDVGDGSSGTCMNPDGTTGTPNDGRIDPCEVAGNPIISNTLKPDVEIFDATGAYAPNPANTKKNALSVGVGFTAVAATF
jgi:hypothetical protein